MYTILCPKTVCPLSKIGIIKHSFFDHQLFIYITYTTQLMHNTIYQKQKKTKCLLIHVSFVHVFPSINLLLIVFDDFSDLVNLSTIFMYRLTTKKIIKQILVCLSIIFFLHLIVIYMLINHESTFFFNPQYICPYSFVYKRLIHKFNGDIFFIFKLLKYMLMDIKM